jgi:5-hydroxyisourate hydrolase
MPGRLTTHVLDLVLGHGAGGLKVGVRRIGPDEPWIAEVELDEGGRGVLLEGEALAAGLYELNFQVGDYHRARGLVEGEGDGFLEEVPVRFRVSDDLAHHHIPLLISLYGYSTYRGG